MYRRGVALLPIVFALTLGLSACDSGSLDLPILTISMTWGVQGDSDRSFSFSSDEDGEISGFVEGTENRGGDSAPFAGSWVEGVLTFTVEWPQQSVTYRAEFDDDNPTSLMLVSGHESLVITQG